MRFIRLMYLIALVSFANALASGHLDEDSDGMSDIWQARYGVSSGEINNDLDGDGFSNGVEEQWGTDPHNPANNPQITVAIDGTNACLKYLTSVGQPTEIYRTKDFLEITLVKTVNGTGLDEQIILPSNTREFFFRRALRSPDQDLDGLNDFEEGLLNTDPCNWDTDADGASDGFEVAKYIETVVNTQRAGINRMRNADASPSQTRKPVTNPLAPSTGSDGVTDGARILIMHGHEAGYGKHNKVGAVGFISSSLSDGPVGVFATEKWSWGGSDGWPGGSITWVYSQDGHEFVATTDPRVNEFAIVPSAVNPWELQGWPAGKAWRKTPPFEDLEIAEQSLQATYISDRFGVPRYSSSFSAQLTDEITTDGNIDYTYHQLVPALSVDHSPAYIDGYIRLAYREREAAIQRMHVLISSANLHPLRYAEVVVPHSNEGTPGSLIAFQGSGNTILPRAPLTPQEAGIFVPIFKPSGFNCANYRPDDNTVYIGNLTHIGIVAPSVIVSPKIASFITENDFSITVSNSTNAVVHWGNGNLTAEFDLPLGVEASTLVLRLKGAVVAQMSFSRRVPQPDKTKPFTESTDVVEFTLLNLFSEKIATVTGGIIEFGGIQTAIPLTVKSQSMRCPEDCSEGKLRIARGQGSIQANASVNVAKVAEKLAKWIPGKVEVQVQGSGTATTSVNFNARNESCRNITDWTDLKMMGNVGISVTLRVSWEILGETFEAEGSLRLKAKLINVKGNVNSINGEVVFNELSLDIPVLEQSIEYWTGLEGPIHLWPKDYEVVQPITFSLPIIDWSKYN